MAAFVVRIFREQSDYLAVVDGWGTVRSPTLRGVREEAKRLVREIVDGAFPPRTVAEQAEGIEILRLRLEVREEVASQEGPPALGEKGGPSEVLNQ